jgi:hypothetical protein
MNNANDVAPSSRGLGHIPFTDVTGVRIPLGLDKMNNSSSTHVEAVPILEQFKKTRLLERGRPGLGDLGGDVLKELDRSAVFAGAFDQGTEQIASSVG